MKGYLPSRILLRAYEGLHLMGHTVTIMASPIAQI